MWDSHNWPYTDVNYSKNVIVSCFNGKYCAKLVSVWQILDQAFNVSCQLPLCEWNDWNGKVNH